MEPRKQLAQKAAKKTVVVAPSQNSLVDTPPRCVKPPPAAKSTVSRMWFVRCDGPLEFVTAKAIELSRSPDTVAMLGYTHLGDKGDNPHIHFVIETSIGVQKQSFALRIKKHFGIEAKSDYSLELWDGSRGAGACSYMFSDAASALAVNKGFSEEDINAARVANDAVAKVVALNKGKASGKFVDRAMKHFEGQDPTEYELLQYMMELSVNNELHWPGQFRAKQMIEECRMKMTPSFVGYVDKMYNSMFR